MTDFSSSDCEDRPANQIASLEDLHGIVLSEPVRDSVLAYGKLIAEAGGKLPEKSKIDPMVLGANLANAVLYDVSDPERVIFKIVGENMKDHFKINPVGRCYLDFVPEFRRPHALSAFRFCAELPCAMLSRTRQVFESGLTRYCEAVGFPLMGSSEDGYATHLLFVDSPVHFQLSDQFDKSPFRFAHMLERHFVDLGHGVPDNFIDLVAPKIPNPFLNA
jgi:hypothetical protein